MILLPADSLVGVTQGQPSARSFTGAIRRSHHIEAARLERINDSPVVAKLIDDKARRIPARGVCFPDS